MRLRFRFRQNRTGAAIRDAEEVFACAHIQATIGDARCGDDFFTEVVFAEHLHLWAVFEHDDEAVFACDVDFAIGGDGGGKVVAEVAEAAAIPERLPVFRVVAARHAAAFHEVEPAVVKERAGDVRGRFGIDRPQQVRLRDIAAAATADGLDDVPAGRHVVGTLEGGVDLVGINEAVFVFVGGVEALVEFLRRLVAGEDFVLIRVEPFEQRVLQRAGAVAVALHGDVDDVVLHDGRDHDGAQQRIAGPFLRAGGGIVAFHLAAAGHDDVALADHGHGIAGEHVFAQRLPLLFARFGIHGDEEGREVIILAKNDHAIMHDGRGRRAPVHQVGRTRHRVAPRFLAGGAIKRQQADGAKVDVHTFAIRRRRGRRVAVWRRDARQRAGFKLRAPFRSAGGGVKGMHRGLRVPRHAAGIDDAVLDDRRAHAIT